METLKLYNGWHPETAQIKTVCTSDSDNLSSWKWNVNIKGTHYIKNV